MKERGLIRIIILLSGALLWVAYLFDAVCSRYAIYEVIGYGAMSCCLCSPMCLPWPPRSGWPLRW